jgi:uncharacterized membrane protein YkvA (DUF1232 family)
LTVGVFRREVAMFGRSAAGDAAGNAAWDASGRDEERVRRGFWPKLRRVAAKLPFAQDLLAAYYCAFDRRTPLQVKAALLGALAYFVLPADAMPDILPLLGYTDDALVLVTALRMVSGHIRDEHREAAREALARELNAAL